MDSNILSYKYYKYLHQMSYMNQENMILEMQSLKHKNNLKCKLNTRHFHLQHKYQNYIQ